MQTFLIYVGIFLLGVVITILYQRSEGMRTFVMFLVVMGIISGIVTGFIDLTQSPEILTTGPDRHLALFGKPTLVENERGVRGIPDQLIGIACHMIKHFTRAPGSL
jgi:hypothetical protein